MKILSILMLVTLLASCGTAVVEKEQTEDENKIIDITEEISQETISDISNAIDELDNMETEEWKVQVINQSYTNPWNKLVEMEISYTLDSQGVITSMDLTSNDERHAWTAFNEVIDNEVVWLTLEQVIDANLTSGSSVTTQSFKEAIKSQL